MSRIVLVSNRVTDLGTAPQAGGVSVAIADIMLTKRAIWFGWNGEVAEAGARPFAISEEKVGQSTIATTTLDQNEYRDYYLGYSNSVLWPVFHNRLDLAQFEAGYYPEYKRVNQRFAVALARMLLPDDIIWIHDYHLILLGAELRALGVRNPIGFFLHIPIPPAQAFLAIPEFLEIASALAAYDLIGLQTRQDVANLIDFFHQSVMGRLIPDGRMRIADRHIRIASYPVGIGLAEFAHDIEESKPEGAEMRIIGVDRLDYTKGLPHKFRAYGHFLEQNPEYRRRVVLSQIAPPTRETLEAYSDIRAELESLAGSINGRYGDLDWVPIYYMHRHVDREQLAGIYRGSRVALITPLRDGMNLVAKEYIAAQDANDPGVLVLSRFAGAAEQLQAAVIVNPYNIEETAGAIKIALEMSLHERRRRHREMFDVIAAESSTHWSNTFIDQLVEAASNNLDLGDVEESRALMDVLEVIRRTLGDNKLQAKTRH